MEVKKIFFDMDGVLADFGRGVEELCGLDRDCDDDLMWEAIKNVVGSVRRDAIYRLSGEKVIGLSAAVVARDEDPRTVVGVVVENLSRVVKQSDAVVGADPYGAVPVGGEAVDDARKSAVSAVAAHRLRGFPVVYCGVSVTMEDPDVVVAVNHQVADVIAAVSDVVRRPCAVGCHRGYELVGSAVGEPQRPLAVEVHAGDTDVISAETLADTAVLVVVACGDF